MPLSPDDIAQIRAALNRIQRILTEAELQPDPIAAWVAAHLIPAPGHTVRVLSAVAEIHNDLGFRVTPQRLGMYVSARRTYFSKGTHYMDTKLV